MIRGRSGRELDHEFPIPGGRTSSRTLRMKPIALFTASVRGLALIAALSIATPGVAAASTVPLSVDHVTTGAPVTFGVPFPKGALTSPDHVRVVNARGVEVPSQVTEVNSWLP